MAADPERTEPNIRQNTKIQYHFEQIQITDGNKFKLMERVSPFHEQLKLTKDRTFEELVKNLEPGGEAIFAVSDEPEPKDLGVVVGRLKQVMLSGVEYNVYLRYLRVVAEAGQQQGIATEFTNEIVRRFCKDGIVLDGFEGRTPNPKIPRADIKSPYIGIIHPIHVLHTYKTIALLAATLPENYKERLDFRTGRCREVYPKGAFRLFSLDNASPEVREMYEIITSPPISADLENGDGIIYFEEVRKRACTLPPKAA
ncbi:hypothetical protein M1437_03005 [Patescibacteria group bacterium]|nr:hypothetical protein [Patescibacteria group bacterium]